MLPISGESGLEVEVVKRVEGTLGWLNRERRLSKHYERKEESADFADSPDCFTPTNPSSTMPPTLFPSDKRRWGRATQGPSRLLVGRGFDSRRWVPPPPHNR